MWPGRPHPSSGRASCINNLKQIGMALEMYRSDQGSYPSDSGPGYLRRLHAGNLVPDGKVFSCTEARKKLSPDPMTGFVIGYEPNPALAGKGSEAYRVPDPASVPWVWERQPFHKDDSVRTVLFLDGHSESMKEADFQAILAKGSR